MKFDIMNNIWADKEGGTGIQLTFLKDARFADVIAPVIDEVPEVAL